MNSAPSGQPCHMEILRSIMTKRYSVCSVICLFEYETLSRARSYIAQITRHPRNSVFVSRSSIVMMFIVIIHIPEPPPTTVFVLAVKHHIRVLLSLIQCWEKGTQFVIAFWHKYTSLMAAAFASVILGKNFLERNHYTFTPISMARRRSAFSVSASCITASPISRLLNDLSSITSSTVPG